MRRLLLVLVLAFIALSADATAAKLQADPDGSGSKCTARKPCSIEKAVANGKDGDRVELAYGTYAPAASLQVNSGIAIAAKNKVKRPTLVTAGGEAQGIAMTSKKASLSDVDVISESNLYGLVSFGHLERVAVITESGFACGLARGTATNTTCISIDGYGVDMAAGGETTAKSRLINVTAIGLGTYGTGIAVESGQGAIQTLTAANTIAVGQYLDVYASSDADSSSTVDLSYSAYNLNEADGPNASITNPITQSNVVSDPAFLDFLTLNFRQQTSSPTVNAGSNAAARGPYDFELQERIGNGTVDIGADEFDNTPPAGKIIDGPTKRGKSATARFVFKSNELGGRFLCALDGAPAEPCTRRPRIDGLTPGKHKLKMTAVDRSDNSDPTPAKYSWTVG